MQRVRLVQRDLEHARGHLHAAGKALRRRIDEGQAIGCKPALARDVVDDIVPAAGGRLRALGSAVGLVGIADLGKYVPPWPRARAPGPEPSAKKPSSASDASFQPAYWLARQAITGLFVRVVNLNGAFAEPESETLHVPRPPMQISARRKPAAMPPGVS